MADRGLQKEAQERLQGFMQQLRGSQAADLSGKRLQDEGLCYICEAIAFNDRWAYGVGADLAWACFAWQGLIRIAVQLCQTSCRQCRLQQA